MTEIRTLSDSITAANILDVTVGTNGYQGGDSGHGCRTLFRLRDSAATAWQIKVDGRLIENPTEIEIVLGGDHEAHTFVKALEFAATTLRGMLGSALFEEHQTECIDM